MALTAQLAWEKAKYFSKYFLFWLVVKIRLKERRRKTEGCHGDWSGDQRRNGRSLKLPFAFGTKMHWKKPATLFLTFLFFQSRPLELLSPSFSLFLFRRFAFCLHLRDITFSFQRRKSVFGFSCKQIRFLSISPLCSSMIAFRERRGGEEGLKTHCHHTKAAVISVILIGLHRLGE